MRTSTSWSSTRAQMHGVEAGQRAGHVLGRLAAVDAHLGRLDVDGMTAEGHHRQLGRAARAGRGLLEHAVRPPGRRAPRRRRRVQDATRAPGSPPSSSHDRSSTSRKWRVMPTPPGASGEPSPAPPPPWRRRGSRAPRRSRRRATSNGGASRMVSGRGAFTTRPRRSAAGVHRHGPFAVEGHPEQQALAPHARPRRRAPRARRARRAPARRGARRGVLASMTARVARAADGRQRLPPERAAVVPRTEGRRHLGARPAGADGHAVAERLGHGDDVGVDARVLEAEPATGAAQTRSGSRPP